MGDREEQTVRVWPPGAGWARELRGGAGTWARVSVRILVSPSKWGRGSLGSLSDQMDGELVDECLGEGLQAHSRVILGPGGPAE